MVDGVEVGIFAAEVVGCCDRASTVSCLFERAFILPVLSTQCARARDTARARRALPLASLSEHSISRVVLASYLAHQDARC